MLFLRASLFAIVVCGAFAAAFAGLWFPAIAFGWAAYVILESEGSK
jgi:hypothetical protein